MTEQELIEALAKEEHAGWGRYMLFFLGKCKQSEDGNLIIDGSYAQAIRTLAETPYDQLDEQQKQHDRDEVARILPIIQEYAQNGAYLKARDSMTTDQPGADTTMEFRPSFVQINKGQVWIGLPDAIAKDLPWILIHPDSDLFDWATEHINARNIFRFTGYYRNPFTTPPEFVVTSIEQVG